MTRIDVAFDRYRETSFKCAKTKKRSRGHAPIRRVLEDGTVPLLRSWSNFLALDVNKADVARFLSENILVGAPVSKIIISPGHNQNWIYDDVTQIFNMAPKPRDAIQGRFSALCYA